MPPQWITHALILLWHLPHVAQVALATATYGTVRRWWQQRQQRLLSEEAKGWPTYRGRVVAVQALQDGSEEHKGKWFGLLTYSYIVDEVEIGEYRQTFSSESETDDWVRAMRERTVTIAVDPRDKRRSIWVAEEAEAALHKTVTKLLESTTAELPLWLEVTRMLTFAVALTGLVMSVTAELCELAALYGYATKMVPLFVEFLPVIAFVCCGIAAYIFRKRFPGSSFGNLGRRLNDPMIDFFLKALGILEGLLFFGLWLVYGDGNEVIHKLTGAAFFPALWVGLFATAAIALRVAGRKLHLTHELAPERRGQMSL